MRVEMLGYVMLAFSLFALSIVVYRRRMKRQMATDEHR